MANQEVVEMQAVLGERQHVHDEGRVDANVGRGRGVNGRIVQRRARGLQREDQLRSVSLRRVNEAQHSVLARGVVRVRPLQDGRGIGALEVTSMLVGQQRVDVGRLEQERVGAHLDGHCPHNGSVGTPTRIVPSTL